MIGRRALLKGLASSVLASPALAQSGVPGCGAGVPRVSSFGAGTGLPGGCAPGLPVFGDPITQLKAAVAGLPLDMLQVYAQATPSLAAVDLAKSSRSMAVSGSPTFTPYRGYTGDGVSAYLETNYNPATDAVNFAQDSNSFGVWSLTNIADPAGGWDFGQTNYSVAPFGTSQRDLFTRDSSATSNSVQFFPQAKNLYSASRTGAAAYSIFQNGAKFCLGYASASNSGNIATGRHGQGWCTDGSFYYTIEQDALRKRSRVDWSIVASNLSPFTGLGGSPNHFGDSDVYNGKLYCAVENYFGSCASSSSSFQIARFDTSTLAFIDTTTVSGMTELSGLAIDPTGGIIYAVSYCDPTKIFRFNLADFSALSSISLSPRDFNFSGIQGITFKNNQLWISCISSGSVAPNRFVVCVDLTGTVLQIISVAETTAQLEGLNFDTNGRLGVMQDDGGVNQWVYFYDLPTESTTSYTQASSAIPSLTFNVFRRNGLLTYTANQVAAVFAGGGMTNAQMRTLYNALYAYMSAVGAT